MPQSRALRQTQRSNEALARRVMRQQALSLGKLVLEDARAVFNSREVATPDHVAECLVFMRRLGLYDALEEGACLVGSALWQRLSAVQTLNRAQLAYAFRHETPCWEDRPYDGACARECYRTKGGNYKIRTGHSDTNLRHRRTSVEAVKFICEKCGRRELNLRAWHVFRRRSKQLPVCLRCWRMKWFKAGKKKLGGRPRAGDPPKDFRCPLCLDVKKSRRSWALKLRPVICVRCAGKLKTE